MPGLGYYWNPMFTLRPDLRAFSAAAGLTVITIGACGSPHDTTFYESPTSKAGHGSGSAGGAGGGGGSASSAGAGTGNASNAGAGGAVTGGASGSGGSALGGASGASGGGASGSLGVGGDLISGDAGMGGAEGGEGGEGPGIDCTPRGGDAVGFDGHCYFFDATAVTWQAATEACQARDAHLVTISSEGRTVAEFLAENAFVWKLSGATQAWIAATDGKGPHQKGDGTFSKWSTDEPMTLDNWSSGQPNNARTSCQENIPCSCDDGACYEHCGFQWETPGRVMETVPGWNDRLCDHQMGFVCEWDG